jgi:hypothetical protein
MKIGGTLYFKIKFKDDHFNFLKLSLSTPYLYAKSDVYEFYAEDQKTIGISLKTCAEFESSAYRWSFVLLVLGFGIGVTRQWSY